MANVVAAVFAVAYVASLGRLMPPAEYSVVAAALSLGYLGSLVVNPLEAGVAKAAAGYHALGEREKLATLLLGGLRRIRLLTLGLIVAWIPIGAAAAGWLHMGNPAALWWLGAFWVMSIPAAIVRGVMRGDHRFGTYGMTLVVEGLVRLPLGLAAVVAGTRAAGALFGYAAALTASVAVGLWYLRDVRALEDSPVALRSMFEASRPLFLTFMFLMFVVNADVIAAKRFLSAHDAGLYGAAATVARLIYVAATPIYQVLFSRVAALHAQKRSSRSLTVAAAGLLTILLVASFAIPWFAGEIILSLVLGKAYVAAAPTLRILWLATSLLVVEALAAFALLGTDRSRGTWGFPVVCGFMVLLLSRYHASPEQIALCNLAAVAAGLPVLLVMTSRGSQPRSHQRDTAFHV